MSLFFTGGLRDELGTQTSSNYLLPSTILHLNIMYIDKTNSNQRNACPPDSSRILYYSVLNLFPDTIYSHIYTQTARQETDDYNSPTLALIIYA